MKRTYRISAPRLKLRTGLVVPKDHLIVRYTAHADLPWKLIRPMIACAYRHTRAEAARTLGIEYLRRVQKWSSELILGRSRRGWWGRNCGVVSRVYVGTLHADAQKTTYPKFKDMPVFWHLDWREHLVGLAAHELWHRWQPGWGKTAEIACELVESDAIDRWRREQGYTFVPPGDEHETETTLPCPVERRAESPEPAEPVLA